MMALGYNEYGACFPFEERDVLNPYSSYARWGLGILRALSKVYIIAIVSDLPFQITLKMANIYGGKHSKAWHSNFAMSVPTVCAPTSY
jgi:hypothetical protein